MITIKVNIYNRIFCTYHFDIGKTLMAKKLQPALFICKLIELSLTSITTYGVCHKSLLILQFLRNRPGNLRLPDLWWKVVLESKQILSKLQDPVLPRNIFPKRNRE